MKRTRLERRMGLRPESPKHRARRGMRSLAVDLALQRDRGCVGLQLIPGHVCGGPLDAHEPLARSAGGDPYDPDQILMVCRKLHDWIGEFPRQAEIFGLRASMSTRYENGRLCREGDA